MPDALLTLDFADRARTVRGALEFHARHPVTTALGVDDDTAVLAAAINEGLGREATSVAAADRARDKQLQRVACSAAGVPVPGFRLHDLEDQPPRDARFPCVVKPLRLAASRGVIRADDAGGLAAALERVAAIVGDQSRLVLIEDFVPGVEVALEGLVQEGELQVLALFDKPDPLDGPFFEESIYVTPSRHVAPVQNAIERVTQQAVTALGISAGPVHAELRVNERGPWLIELAARPIGGRCSAAVQFPGGATLEEIICRHALGMPLPRLARPDTASGVMMIPVPGAGVLREVRGLADARAVPLIQGVDITSHPGERLVPWPEGSRYPGFIFAAGPTPQAVEAALRKAHGYLDFVLEAEVTPRQDG